MYIYAKLGGGNEYLYSVNFTRIEYLRATARPAANSRVLRELRNTLCYSSLLNTTIRQAFHHAAKEPFSGCEMYFFR